MCECDAVHVKLAAPLLVYCSPLVSILTKLSLEKIQKIRPLEMKLAKMCPNGHKLARNYKLRPDLSFPGYKTQWFEFDMPAVVEIA